jgi:hypothetical protein
VYQVGNNKKSYIMMHGQPNIKIKKWHVSILPSANIYIYIYIYIYNAGTWKLKSVSSKEGYKFLNVTYLNFMLQGLVSLYNMSSNKRENLKL